LDLDLDLDLYNGLWRRVSRFSYSELITYCLATSRHDKIAWKYIKTANIIQNTAVCHTVNGDPTSLNTSKTAKMIKVKQHFDIGLMSTCCL